MTPHDAIKLVESIPLKRPSAWLFDSCSREFWNALSKWEKKWLVCFYRGTVKNDYAALSALAVLSGKAPQDVVKAAQDNHDGARRDLLRTSIETYWEYVTRYSKKRTKRRTAHAENDWTANDWFGGQAENVDYIDDYDSKPIWWPT